MLAIVLGALPALAGPLTPPAGPVTSTGKTLTEAEPRTAINAVNTPGDADSVFRITQPGAYYLTGNITGVAGKRGIEIAASGVSIDLNGFDLVGTAAAGDLDGVASVAVNLSSIEVRNGSIRNWGGDGIDLSTFGVIGVVVKDVRVIGNLHRGIASGTGGVVTGCTAADNGGDGIDAGPGSTVTDTIAYRNSGSGIVVNSGSTITRCASRFNSLNGISVVNQCHVIGNVCSSNGNGAGDGAGILVQGNDNHIEGNTCTRADRGMDVNGTSNFIVRNTCSGNTVNWTIAIGNSIGPIVVAGTNVAAINSNGPVASTLGSTDPNANFSF